MVDAPARGKEPDKTSRKLTVPPGYEQTLRRDPANVRFWLTADIRREPAERPLMTHCGHSLE